MKPNRFEHIQCPACVDLEIGCRITHAVGDGDLSRQVQYGAGLAHGIDHRDRIADVGHCNGDQIAVPGF